MSMKSVNALCYKIFVKYPCLKDNDHVLIPVQRKNSPLRSSQFQKLESFMKMLVQLAVKFACSPRCPH